MTASPATRSKDFRERHKAKLARYEAMFRVLWWISIHSTDSTARAMADRTLDTSPKQGQPA